MPRRPGVITFIGVIMIIQAVLNGIGGIVSLALNTQTRILEETGLSSGDLVVSGIVSLVVAAIILLVALMLLGGSRGARILVTIVQVLAVAAAAYHMFAHHTGAYLFSGLITFAIALFVLWALYNERSDEYFESS